MTEIGNEIGVSPATAALARYRHGRTASNVQAAIAWINCWPGPKELRSDREFDGYWEGAAEAAQKFGYRLEEFVAGPALTSISSYLFTR